MTRHLTVFGPLVVCVVAWTAGVAAAMQSTTPSKGAKPPDVLTLSGCVSSAPTAPRVFTLADADGQTYRLTGTNVKEYLGQHVEILGTPSKRLRVVGGLYPNPNVAAQAGSIDPTKAAIASQSGSANASQPVVEFKVKSVRATPGGCGDR